MASLALIGCANDPAVSTQNQLAECNASGDVPIYSNRFAPSSGGSGVATAPDALAGKISSDSSSSSGGASAGAPAASGAKTDTAPASGGSSSSGSESVPMAELTAMTVSCGHSTCGGGKVAVVVPPKSGGGGGAGGIATGGPSLAIDVATPTPAAAPVAPTVETVCAEPPPDCPAGQSPQFTINKTWECTDCSLVVTYGGIYGNYRRCVGMPHIDCTGGDVPTWKLEDEKWECKPKCDNGLYDQHTISGQMVCVPC